MTGGEWVHELKVHTFRASSTGDRILVMGKVYVL